MTLIEVMAGLAILSTLLVSMVLAKARLTRQWALAERKLEAVEAADALLKQWHTGKAEVPLDGRGEAPSGQALTWRTRETGSAEADALGVHIVRLEILDARERPRVSLEDEPLTSVEFVVPREEPDDAP